MNYRIRNFLELKVDERALFEDAEENYSADHGVVSRPAQPDWLFGEHVTNPAVALDGV